MTHTEALIVLAYRANISIRDIIGATGIERKGILEVLEAHPTYVTESGELLKAALR